MPNIGDIVRSDFKKAFMQDKATLLTYLKKEGFTRRDVMIARSEMRYPKAWKYYEDNRAHYLEFSNDLANHFYG